MSHYIKPGLVILGASGGVGQSLLLFLARVRERFGSLVLVDLNESYLENTHIQHNILQAIFIKKDLTTGIDIFFKDIRSRYPDISIVLDATDLETRHILSAVDAEYLQYVNCGTNNSSLKLLVKDLNKYSTQFNRSAHVLNVGMNPGIVDLMLLKGFFEHGLPEEFIEFEYDSTYPEYQTQRPFVTWSKKRFLSETSWELAGFCGTDGKYTEKRKSTALLTLEDLGPILDDLGRPKETVLGMMVPHEEVITMSRVLEIPGKFVYAISPSSLNQMIDIHKKFGCVSEDSVDVLSNKDNTLLGSDLVGVCLKYTNKTVYYYVEVFNKEVRGTNATLYLVGLGAFSCLMSILDQPILDKGVFTAQTLKYQDVLSYFERNVKIHTHVK